MSSRITRCGLCPQFKLEEEPDPRGWEGKCQALGIGRHANTQPCQNKNLQTK